MDRSTVITLLALPISNGARLTWLLLPPKEPTTIKTLAKDALCTEREVRRRVDELVAAKLAERTTVRERDVGFYYSRETNAVRRLQPEGPNSPAVAGDEGTKQSAVSSHPSAVKPERRGMNASLPKSTSTKRTRAVRPTSTKKAKKKKARR